MDNGYTNTSLLDLMLSLLMLTIEIQSDGDILKSLTCVFQNLSQTWLLRELLSDFRDEEKSVLITPSSSSSSELVRVTILL